MMHRGASVNGRKPPPRADSRVRAARIERGLSQAELGEAAGLTRQAIYAIESHRYLPNVSVALRLGRTLGRRVEDLFPAPASGALLEGELLRWRRGPLSSPRAKVWSVGDRVLVLPVADLGPSLTYATAADALIVGVGEATAKRGRVGERGRVRVELIEDPVVARRQVVVAGCDPAIQLVADRLGRQKDPTPLLGWPMGSTAAVEALKRGEVHVAGLHVVDPRSGEPNLPFLRRHLRDHPITLVTFASWEAGLLVSAQNPKAIRGPADLARKDVRLVNREEGSGARLLLDQRLKKAGVPIGRVRGHGDVVLSHLEVGRRIAEGLADVGVGVESVARLLGLGFVPLQTERYDLAIPSALVSTHPGVGRLLEALVSREVRAEIEALGGYSTRRMGSVVDQRPR
jgi:putative molybdopterin biosynthesis protein